MMQVDVNVTRATLIPPRESLTPGMLNAVQLHFNFSDEWSGLEKICVFSNEIETAPAVVENDTVSIPDAILNSVYRWVSVGVTGEDGDGSVIIPTIWCRIGQVLPGAGGASSKFVTVDMLENYWSKSEIDLQTEGDGKKFLADDGLYYSVSHGGGDDKVFIAEYNVTTAQEIIAFADATKEPFAPILVKRGADYYTVTTVSKQAANKVILVTFASLSGNYYTFTYTITDGTWASSSYGFQKLLESGVNIKTVGGQSLLGSGDIPVQGLNQVQADWNEADTTSPAYIQNKPTIPDVSDLATKDELTAAVAPLATKDELTNATSGLATTAAMNAALALKADKTELNSYAKQYDVNQALDSKADKVATQTALDGKADKTELSAYAKTTDVSSTYATKTEVAGKADKSEIITVTTGTGTLFLADDGTYRPASGDPPDLTPYLKKDEASATYETQTHASETYATKSELPDVSDMLTKAEASGTYATQTELSLKADKSELENYAEKSDIITVTTGDGTQFLADDGTYKRVQTDLSSYLTKTEAEQTYATQTEVADKADKSELPDVSDMLTKTEAESSYADKVSLHELDTTVESQSARINTLDANKADKTQIITVTTGTGTLFLADDGTYKPAAGDPPDLSAYLTKTEASTTYTTNTYAEATYATKEAMTIADNELQEAIDLKADASALADYETTVHAEATYATKAELPDVSDMLTKTEAGTTYATKAELADKADASALADYETTAHAEATYATKAELPDVSDMLTKTEASTTYATIASVDATYATKEALTIASNELQDQIDLKADASALSDYETTAHAAATYETKADASQVKSVTAAGFAVAPDAAGNVNIGGTDVSRVGTSGSWGSEITYTIAQTLPTGATSDTKGSTLTVVKRTENSGANPRVTMTVDGVQLATSADIPDVSRFATTDYVQNTFESTAHASATYLKISDASATYATKSELPDVSDMLTNTEASTTYLTKTDAASTYATQTALADKADASAISDMATKTWVQEYIASLDGTNMSV